MPEFFAVLFMASLVLLIIGLKSPKTAMFWKKNQPVTKKQSTVFYACAAVISIVVVAITAPPVLKSKSKGSTESTAEKKADVAKSEENPEYALARSCDTNYRFISNPDKYLVNQKGFFVDFDLTQTDEKEWYKKPWAAVTYKQVGPTAFEIDKTRKLLIYTALEVQTVIFGREPSNGNDGYFLLVSAIGSSERYIIRDYNFTLKDVNSCSLLQKAKNEFYAMAEYIAPSDPNDRPIDDTNESWIDVPAGAHILVNKYSDRRHTIDGTIYNADGSLHSLFAHFKPETLREVKL